MRENGDRIYYSPNIVNLCIDAYNAEKQCGKLWSQYGKEPVSFSSLFEALERMEELYDILRYPYASTETRSFLTDGRESEGKSGEGRHWKQCGAVREDEISENRTDEEKTFCMAESFENVIGHRGQDATFLVRVQDRQHSSWQGEVVWVDGGKRCRFESILELTRLVDNAMEGKYHREAAKWCE